MQGPKITFKLCGAFGLATGIPLTLALAWRLELVPWLMVSMAAVAFMILLVTGMAAKILTGTETLIYYRYAIVIFTVTAVIPLMFHVPVLAYMDVTFLGAGIFLACGRIGCLMVGCCHGRMCGWGIRYGKEQANEGFPTYLVGVRLFPIQAVESIFVLFLVAFGTASVLRGSPPGTVLGFYVVAYACGRFWIEFARGDPERLYFCGFSEAQWTSLFLAIVVVCAEHASIIPLHTWHVWVALILVTSMIVISSVRRLQQASAFDLLHPRHVRELAGAIQIAIGAGRHPAKWETSLGPKPGAEVIHLAHTSLGIQVSASDIIGMNNCLRHYTLSKETGYLSLGSARILAVLIARLNHASSRFELLQRNSGVFHLLFETDSVAYHKEF